MIHGSGQGEESWHLIGVNSLAQLTWGTLFSLQKTFDLQYIVLWWELYFSLIHSVVTLTETPVKFHLSLNVILLPWNIFQMFLLRRSPDIHYRVSFLKTSVPTILQVFCFFFFRSHIRILSLCLMSFSTSWCCYQLDKGCAWWKRNPMKTCSLRSGIVKVKG